MAEALTLSRRPDDDDGRLWSVSFRGQYVGSVTRAEGVVADIAWRWSVNIHAGRFGNGHVMGSGQTHSREAAMRGFRVDFDRYLGQIGPEGWENHVAHMARLAERNQQQSVQRQRSAAMPITINTLEDYEAATAEVQRLTGAPEDTPEEARLIELVEAIEAWDAKHDDATRWS